MKHEHKCHGARFLCPQLYWHERVHSGCRCHHSLHSFGNFVLCVQSSCTWGCMLIQNQLQPVLFGGHVDGTSREVRVGPIEGLLHGNTYMPPIVQHPGFSGYAPLHSTMPQVNPGSVAEQGGTKVLPRVCGLQWDIFNLQATWQSMITNFFPLMLGSPLYSICM